MLTASPLHANQFAYQKAKSTTMTLYSLVEIIEKTFQAKELTLGVFIDIEGAFGITSSISPSKELWRLMAFTHLL